MRSASSTVSNGQGESPPPLPPLFILRYEVGQQGTVRFATEIYADDNPTYSKPEVEVISGRAVLFPRIDSVQTSKLFLTFNVHLALLFVERSVLTTYILHLYDRLQQIIHGTRYMRVY